MFLPSSTVKHLEHRHTSSCFTANTTASIGPPHFSWIFRFFGFSMFLPFPLNRTPEARCVLYHVHGKCYLKRRILDPSPARGDYSFLKHQDSPDVHLEAWRRDFTNGWYHFGFITANGGFSLLFGFYIGGLHLECSYFRPTLNNILHSQTYFFIQPTNKLRIWI